MSITGLFLSLAEFELDPVTAAVNHFNHVVAGLPQLALIGVTGVDKVEKERTVGIENLILCLGVIVIYRDVKHLAVFCAQNVTMRRARYQMARARLRPNAPCESGRSRCSCPVRGLQHSLVVPWHPHHRRQRKPRADPRLCHRHSRYIPKLIRPHRADAKAFRPEINLCQALRRRFGRPARRLP